MVSSGSATSRRNDWSSCFDVPTTRRYGELVGPVALGFLLAAGTIKSSSALQWLPFDLTASLGILLLLALAGHFLRAIRVRSPIQIGWALGAGAFWLYGMIMMSTPTEYGDAKAKGLLLLTLGCCFLGGLYLLRISRQRYAFAVGTILAAIVVMILARVAPSQDEGSIGRLALAGAATIGPSRVFGAALVVVLTLSIAGRFRLRYSLPLSTLLIISLVATGSRGPIVALVLASLAILPFLRSGRLRSWVVVGSMFFFGWTVLANANATIRDRLLLLFADDKGASVLVREEIWHRSFVSISDTPFGRGWGGLAPSLLTGTNYPHNIVLEVAGEVGLLMAGGALVVGVIASTRLARQASAGDCTALVFIALLTYFLVNAMVSGDLNDNRGIFVVVGAALSLPRRSATVRTE